MSENRKNEGANDKPAAAAANKPTRAVVKKPTGDVVVQFRLNAKNLFCTWPQTALPKENAFKQLKTILGVYGIKYLLVCQERHEEEGLHLHAVAILDKKVNFKDCRCLDLSTDWISRDIHGQYQAARAIRDAIAYCKKKDNWLEEGESPAIQAKKKGKALKDLLLAKTIEEAIDDGELSPYHIKMATILKQTIALERSESQQRQKPTVNWFWGPTGSGKTRKAVELSGDYWMSNENLKWFDGYNGQKVAILDDLRVDSCPWGFLLRLLDRYKLRVPVKGGYVAWTPDIIIVTAPALPETMFVNHTNGEVWDKIEQLKRRIDVTEEFEKPPEKPEEKEEKPTKEEATWDEESLSPRRRKMELEELEDDACSWIAGRIAMMIEDGEIPLKDPEEKEEKQEKIEKPSMAEAKKTEEDKFIEPFKLAKKSED
ncbi:replication-associated protein, putative [Entamoeba invadens IP1]|uniref:ATP-dependent helicase Rep n=1 Tax=Entamoeba invadens IP1 TaxID=370355 RepID=L7FMK9_ENTIV|nr:replication-associated protein, putative [Entamoeba invadens IP1]ELP86386.1 replication-associated protein, putative [Entamoeba invadens IP1]|eukprot:XP_004185732.1 replication-associated protein, putative [Entamoeba invadens IP1]